MCLELLSRIDRDLTDVALEQGQLGATVCVPRSSSSRSPPHSVALLLLPHDLKPINLAVIVSSSLCRVGELVSLRQREPGPVLGSHPTRRASSHLTHGEGGEGVPAALSQEGIAGGGIRIGAEDGAGLCGLAISA